MVFMIMSYNSVVHGASDEYTPSHFDPAEPLPRRARGAAGPSEPASLLQVI